MQESSLHAALKDLYTQPGCHQEVLVDGFLIDVVQGETLIEIQTRNFTAIRPKLAVLLERHPVRLVHPIAREKWIVRLPADSSDPLDRRKSPRRGRPEHLFVELVRIPHLVSHPNLTLEVLLTQEEEVRRDDGQGSWRRKGWSIADRRLLQVIERIELRTPEDFLRFLPPDLPQPFTSKDFAKAVGVPRYLAQKAAYCLRAMGLLEVAGKRSQSLLYLAADLTNKRG